MVQSDPWIVLTRLAVGASAAAQSVGGMLRRLWTDYTTARAVKIDNLDASISSVKAKTDLIPAAGPPSAADYTSGRAANLNNLDTAVSGVKAKTDLIPSAGPASAAFYTSTRAAKLDTIPADVWGNATRTLSAFGFSVIKSIQYGTITTNAVTTGSATITAVNTAKAVLIHLGAWAPTTPGYATVRIALTNSTTVSAFGASDSGLGYEVGFVVVEFN
jgi:hypothetical protein